MARGGTRKGAGRKKGSKAPKTMQKLLQLELLKQRVFKAQNPIINGLLTNAMGVSFLYKIEKTKIVGPKGGISYKPERPKLVTSPYEIEEYLSGLVDEGDAEDENDPGASYYYITTEKPETAAARELWDRTFGKAAQPLTGETGGPVVVKLVKYGGKATA